MNSASAVASGLVDLIGNVTLTQNSQFTLSHNATQTGSLSLVNQANATVNNATLTGDVNLADTSRFTLSNQATQIGTISLHQQAQATVDNANLNGNVHLTDSAQFSLKTAIFRTKFRATKTQQ